MLMISASEAMGLGIVAVSGVFVAIGSSPLTRQPRVYRQIIGYIPSNVIPAIVSFLMIYAYTRLLSPAAFGNYSYVFSAVLVPADVVVLRFADRCPTIFPRECASRVRRWPS